jgi:hypothetical protein
VKLLLVLAGASIQLAAIANCIRALTWQLQPVRTILAAADGIVTFAAWDDGGYGNVVELTHADGSLTLYAHTSKILVSKGTASSARDSRSPRWVARAGARDPICILKCNRAVKNNRSDGILAAALCGV